MVKKITIILLLIQFSLSLIPVSFASEGNKCKNYTDCNYAKGEFCVGSGICKNICPTGKVSPGLNSGGESLPCQSGYVFSGSNDLSGRKICCQKNSSKELNKKEEEKSTQKVFGKLCEGSSDCKEEEFCAYTESSDTRCGIYNCDGSYISMFACPSGELLLAQGPEGYFCCPLIYTGKKKSLDFDSSEKKSIQNTSGGKPSSSSGNIKPPKPKKKKTPLPPPKEYSAQIILQTPEIFRAMSFFESGKSDIPLLFKSSSGAPPGSSSGGSSTSSHPSTSSGTTVQKIETHYYRPGEKVSFGVYVKGPPLSKPQDISSYTLTAIASQKDSAIKSPTLKILEIWVEDIIAATDLSSLLTSAPPLNIVALKQDAKGSFKAVNGDIFMLKLPESRYLSNTSGRIVLAVPENPDKSIPENKCSPAGGNVCGSDSISVANCISKNCYKYTKGSQFAKDCCKGVELSEDVDEIPISSTSSSGGKSSSSSGAVDVIPKPTCNNDKEVECKITNKIYVPYCSKRNILSCSEDGKPFCMNVSSSGAASLEEPSCLLQSKASDEYCKDVSMLLYLNGFDPSSCVNDYCLPLKSIGERRTCCVACGLIYDKVKNPNIEYSEVEQNKSCIGFDGGYCGSIKNTFTCVESECYKFPQGSTELKLCCSKNDKNLSVLKALMESGSQSEEQGMIYNLIALGSSSLKVKKTEEDILGQTFEILLPSDSSIDSVLLKASFKDKKGKTRESQVRIGFLDRDVDDGILTLDGKGDDSEEGDAPAGRLYCQPPIVSSSKVSESGEIISRIGEALEIPIIVNDSGNNISDLKAEGLNTDFKLENVTTLPSYYYSIIKGVAKTLGKQEIAIKVSTKCGKNTEYKFKINVLKPGEEIPIQKE